MHIPVFILVQIAQKFDAEGPIHNKSVFVQMMVLCRTDNTGTNHNPVDWRMYGQSGPLFINID